MPVMPNTAVQINVGEFLSNPTRITRQLEQRLTLIGTIADYAFTAGDANQGAVVYDELLSESLAFERDVEVIAPGAEFPEVIDASLQERVARVAKYGGKIELTWEAIRRNDQNEVSRKLNVLAHLVAKRVNAVSVAAIMNNPNIQKMEVADSWAPTTSDPIGDVFSAKSLVDDADLGYATDLALINPLDSVKYFLGRKDIRQQFPSTATDNPVLAGDLGRIADLEWIKSSRIPRGNIFILQRGVSGSVRDEEGGLKTNPYDDNDRQVRVLQAWRSIVPIITDPRSIVQITGFDS